MLRTPTLPRAGGASRVGTKSWRRYQNPGAAPDPGVRADPGDTPDPPVTPDPGVTPDPETGSRSRGQSQIWRSVPDPGASPLQPGCRSPGGLWGAGSLRCSSGSQPPPCRCRAGSPRRGAPQPRRPPPAGSPGSSRPDPAAPAREVAPDASHFSHALALAADEGTRWPRRPVTGAVRGLSPGPNCSPVSPPSPLNTLVLLPEPPTPNRRLEPRDRPDPPNPRQKDVPVPGWPGDTGGGVTTPSSYPTPPGRLTPRRGRRTRDGDGDPRDAARDTPLGTTSCSAPTPGQGDPPALPPAPAAPPRRRAEVPKRPQELEEPGPGPPLWSSLGAAAMWRMRRLITPGPGGDSGDRGVPAAGDSTGWAAAGLGVSRHRTGAHAGWILALSPLSRSPGTRWEKPPLPHSPPTPQPCPTAPAAGPTSLQPQPPRSSRWGRGAAGVVAVGDDEAPGPSAAGAAPGGPVGRDRGPRHPVPHRGPAAVTEPGGRGVCGRATHAAGPEPRSPGTVGLLPG